MFFAAPKKTRHNLWNQLGARYLGQFKKAPANNEMGFPGRQPIPPFPTDSRKYLNLPVTTPTMKLQRGWNNGTLRDHSDVC